MDSCKELIMPLMARYTCWMQQPTSTVGEKNNLFLDRIKGKQFVLFLITANLHFKEKEFPIWREDVCAFRFAAVKTSCGGF